MAKEVQVKRQHRASPTQLANLQKGIDIQRRRGEITVCQRGHNDWEFTKNGKRFCRPCKVMRNREWRARQKTVVVPPVRKFVHTGRKLTFDERQTLRRKISEIQTAREKRVKRMWVRTADGDRVYLGGDSRPENEQIKSGYPSYYDFGNKAA